MAATTATLFFWIAVLVLDLSLRGIASRRGRENPMFTPAWMAAPRYANRNLNTIDLILQRAVMPTGIVVALAASVLMFRSIGEELSPALYLLGQFGVLLAIARSIFLDGCRAFAEFDADGTPRIA
ncbi:MAG: hypothetical protein QM648_02060 [Solirubrobacterales bacterium]